MNKAAILALCLMMIASNLSFAAEKFATDGLKAESVEQDTKDQAKNGQASAAAKGNVITIETATIRGNQELPTVLYLVPWQPPTINPLPASQTAEISQQPLEKIERNSFRRLLHYHQQFKINTP